MKIEFKVDGIVILNFKAIKQQKNEQLIRQLSY